MRCCHLALYIHLIFKNVNNLEIVFVLLIRDKIDLNSSSL
jgi:hypothetical protein